MSDQAQIIQSPEPTIESLQGQQNVMDTGSAEQPRRPAPEAEEATPAVQPQSQPQPSPAGGQASPQPQPGTDAAAQQHQSALGEIFQTLAGGKKKVWQQTDKGPVATYEDLKPGEMARGILAAALSGLAGGYDPARRGKGPAMAAAFSGGFKANEERVEKQEAGKAEEAQKQFQNSNIADEKMLQLHRDAREQQESIDRAHESYLRQTEMKDQIARGQLHDKNDAIDRDNIDAAKQQVLINSGATQVQDPTGKGPLKFTSETEMLKWVQQDQANANHVLHPGKFDTVLQRDPTDGTWSVWEKPQDYDHPRWYGVEMEADGITPKKDKDGKMIADKKDPLYDQNGKPAVPAGMMPRSQFDRQNAQTLENRARIEEQKMHAQEYAARAAELKEQQEKNSALKLARAHYDAAGGDPNAVDPKTGMFYMTPSDRDVYAESIQAEFKIQQATLVSGLKELSNMDPKDPARAGLQEIVDGAKSAINNLQNRQTLFNNHNTAVDVTVSRLGQKYTDPTTGKVDIDKAFKDLAGMPKSFVDSVISKLKEQKARPSDSQKDALSDPKVFQVAQQHAAGLLKSGKSVQEVVGEINQTPQFSANDKKRLIESVAGAADKSLSITDASNTVFLSPNGGTQIIPNDAAEAFKANHPDFKVLGVGTKQPDKNNEQASR